MKRWLVCLGILLSCVAVRGAPVFTQFPARSLGVHQMGGITGMQAWYVLMLDGTVYRQERGQRVVGTSLSPGQVQALVERADRSGFFNWNARYDGAPPIPDGMTTELWVDDGHRSNRVVVSDPGPPPAGFYDLVNAIRAAAKAP